MSEIDKAAARLAIVAYAAEYEPDVGMSDLRSFVRDRTGLDFGGPTLAALLKAMGYRREGYRNIDSCPGRTVFYVKVSS